MLYYAVIVLIFVIGIILGAAFEHRKIMVKSWIGNLRVDRSDEDGPYLFIEVDPDAHDFISRKMVTLTVVHKDFLPRN